MIKDQAKQIAERYAEAYHTAHTELVVQPANIMYATEAAHAIALHLALQESAAPPVVQEPPAPAEPLLRRVEQLVHETALGEPLPPMAQLAHQLQAQLRDVTACLTVLSVAGLVTKERVKGAPAYVRRWVRCGLTRGKE